MTSDHPRCVHGVAYKITEEQLDQVYRTEGDGRPGGYRCVDVKVKTYDGQVIPAITLHVNCNDAPSKKDYPSSKRYMGLILTGCAQEGIQADYVDWLKKRRALDRSALQKDHPTLYRISWVFLILMAPFFFFIILPSFALAKVPFTSRKFRRAVLWPLDMILHAFSKVFWFAHDRVVAALGDKEAQELLCASSQKL